MTYEFFKIWVQFMCDKAGGLLPVLQNNDGKYVASCGDVTITGNSVSKIFTVRWGDEHIATFPQPEAAL